MNEVTQDELLSKYDVQLKKELTTAWVKDLILTDATGEEFNIRITWDMDKGYNCIHNSNVRIPEMDRPEFEYVLDSITEDMKHDRNNPWDLFEFGSAE